MELKDQLHALSEESPVEAAEIIGTILANIPTFTNQASKSFGTAILSTLNICDRLDFLIDSPRFHPKDKDIFEQNIEWATTDSGGIVLIDKADRYLGLSVQISRDTECYEIIDLEFPGEPDLMTGWWFIKRDDAVVAVEPITSFYNMRRTKLTAFMIKWVTNILGFEKN